jgi:hypothetical protein
MNVVVFGSPDKGIQSQGASVSALSIMERRFLFICVYLGPLGWQAARSGSKNLCAFYHSSHGYIGYG